MIKMQGLLPFPAARSSSEGEANQQCRDRRKLNSEWVQSISIIPPERKSQIHESIAESGPQFWADFLSSLSLK